jgi:hypothetical protein
MLKHVRELIAFDGHLAGLRLNLAFFHFRLVTLRRLRRRGLRNDHVTITRLALALWHASLNLIAACHAVQDAFHVLLTA